MNFIRKIILWIAASWLAVYATSYFFPEYIAVEWWVKAFAMIWVIFWILNSVIKPILKIISLPFIIITAWLFVLVVNWAIIFITEYFFQLMPSLWVSMEIIWGFLSYIIVALVLWVINHLTHWLVDIKK